MGEISGSNVIVQSTDLPVHGKSASSPEQTREAVLLSGCEFRAVFCRGDDATHGMLTGTGFLDQFDLTLVAAHTLLEVDSFPSNGAGRTGLFTNDAKFALRYTLASKGTGQ